MFIRARARPGLAMGLLVSCLLISGLTVATIEACAQIRTARESRAINPAGDNKRKLNLAGRLSMLSQYLTKSVCFHGLGPHAAPQPNELGFASELFNQSLDDLRNGSEVQEILPVTEPGIIAAIDRTALIWRGFSAAVEARDIAGAVKLDADLLASTQTILGLLEARNTATGVMPGLAAAIHFGGLERVLTQKAAKEFCHVAAGRETAANKANLAATVGQIDRALQSLLDIDGPNAGEVADQLALVKTRWAGLRAVLMRATEAASPSTADVTDVVRRNIAVMTAFTRLIEIYELAE